MDGLKRMWAFRGLLLGSFIAVGCNTDTTDGRDATGSRAMITSSDYSALYVATADDGVVSRVDLQTQAATTLDVGGEPTRAARIDDRVFVTLRTERAIVEMTEVNGALVEGRKFSVGAEPVGIAASSDGTRLYVAVSMTGRVIELDAESLERLRIWELPDEPRWLATHPEGKALYVASAWGSTMVHIDLASGRAKPVDLPTPFFLTPSRPNQGPTEALSRRVTGDPAVSPEGGFVALPALFVDNTTPISESATDEPPPPGEEGYSGRINPSVVVMPIDKNGTPIENSARTVMLLNEFVGGPTGYLSSLTISPDGAYIAGPMEGVGILAYFRVEDLQLSDTTDIVLPPVGLIKTGSGPRAVAFVSQRSGYVYNAFARSVEAFTLSTQPGSEFGASTNSSIRVSTAQLPDEVEAGRELFFSAVDPRVTSPRSSVSCATCHFEGRNDGLTWMFERGPRQTPSLAGMISLREPVRWDGLAATVADDALATSTGLMGGLGMSSSEAQAIATFIDYVRSVDIASETVDDQLAEQGREIFNRPDVACGTCHGGPIFSDKQLYNMYGLDSVKTPSLLGVAATPPYLHDGRMNTLRQVLESARNGEMGFTGDLSAQEMDALEAYLRTL